MSEKNHLNPLPMPNNFSAKPALQDMAPNLGTPSYKTSPNSNERGKDGTQK